MPLMRKLNWVAWLAIVGSAGCGETFRCWRMNHPIVGRLPPRPAVLEPAVPAPPPGQSLYPVLPNGRCCPSAVPAVPGSSVSPSTVPNGPYVPAPPNGLKSPSSGAPSSSYYAPLPSPGWQAVPAPATGIQPADHRTTVPTTPVADFPVDIARWQVPYQGVASGLYPHGQGWDWLRQKGYRTVLHLKSSGEDDSGLRGECERRGLRYLVLEVEPQTLNRELVLRFSQTLADRSLHPIFITDKDGVRAGALWYLHYRLTEKLDEAEARRRAAQHGLADKDPRPEVAELWQAVQNVLQSP
ncbi:MAG: hypothetical protein RMI91_00530 [Gemmatales bacterium]|nr:hypothetical protein [Gemmatales bacterium]MDW7993117.1 hypothetical protein [Gemmatales bacterium]